MNERIDIAQITEPIEAVPFITELQKAMKT